MNSALEETITKLYSDKGKEWLKNLPDLLSSLEKRWHFTVMEAFPHLTYNYVVRVSLANGNAAVLKCGVPNPETCTEIAALKHFNGSASVSLLEADESLGAMLLEQVLPGIPVIELEDNEATEIFAHLIKKLHQPIQDTSLFPTVQKWFEGFDRLYHQFGGKTGPFSSVLVDYAYQTGKELLNSMSEPVLLHGDLHHMNILSATREPWLAIDPKGVIGEREYEVGAFMRNPTLTLTTRMDTKKILTRRIEILTDITGFDKKRIIAWSLYQAVLAAIWCFEDRGTGFEPFIQCVEALREIK